MDQTELSIGIIGVLALNGLVLIWVIDQISHLRSDLKKAKTHSAPAVSAEDKQRLEQSLQQKAETEVKVITDRLSANLQSFGQELKQSLLDQASSSLKSQMSQPEKAINEFNTSMTATLQSLTMALREAGKTAQTQLEAGVAQQKQLLVEQFQQNMASLVTSHLVKALGKDSISGDQPAQIIQLLEAHKDELKKDLLHET